MSAAAASLTTSLQSRVIRTRHVPVLGNLYRLAYAAAPSLVSALLRIALGKRIEAVYIRRGMAGNDWTPGASDLDILVRIAATAPGEEAEMLTRLWRAHAGIRRLVPFLGETQVADSTELRDYQRHGGARASEMTAWKRFPPKDSNEFSPASPSILDVLHEAVSAFFLQSQVYFEDGSARWTPNSGFKTRKAFLDVLRNVRCLLRDRPLPPSRAEELELQRGKLAAELIALLERAERIGRTDAYRFLVISLLWLDRACERIVGELPTQPADQDPGPSNWERAEAARFPELGDWRRRLHALAAPGLPAGMGFYFDSLFHWYVVTPRMPSSEEHYLACRQLDAWKRSDDAFQGQGHIVTRAILQATIFSTIQDNPFLGLGLTHGEREGDLLLARHSRAPLFRRHYRLQWNLRPNEFKLPDESQRLLLARRAAADLSLSLRMYGQRIWGGSNTYRTFYWYSRVLGLRLCLDSGSAFDFQSLDRLLRQCADRFPASRSTLAALDDELQRDDGALDAADPARLFYRHLIVLRPILRAALDG